MSTFGGKLEEPEFEGICIDRFTEDNYDCTTFFLSHYHSDHMKGLKHIKFQELFQNNKKLKFYCSSITKTLMLRNRNIDITPDRIIEVETEPFTVHNLNGEEINVIPMGAGHCPGSLMLLYQFKDNSVLYTGDFRHSREDLKRLKGLQNNGKLIKISKVYLDSTFAFTRYTTFPTREESLHALLNLIKRNIDKHDYIVIKQPAYIGLEGLMIGIYECLKQPIYVSNEICFNYCSAIKELNNVIVTKMSKSKIHFCPPRGNIKCTPCPLKNERYKNILNIKPSAMIFTQENMLDNGAEYAETKNFVRLAFSNHSSLDELTAFVKYLQVYKIYPLVVPSNKCVDDIVTDVLFYIKPEFTSGKTIPLLEFVHENFEDIDAAFKDTKKCDCFSCNLEQNIDPKSRYSSIFDFIEYSATVNTKKTEIEIISKEKAENNQIKLNANKNEPLKKSNRHIFRLTSKDKSKPKPKKPKSRLISFSDDSGSDSSNSN